MNLRHFKIFLAVCDNNCNTTHAAQALYLVQPAVSRAIQELERDYGVRLFDRLSRKLYLTEAGLRFREYAKHIVSLEEELETGMRSLSESATVCVGASITIGSQFLPGYVEAYQAQFPCTQIHVQVTASESLERAVCANEADIALIEGTVHNASLISEAYMKDRLLVVASPQYGFSPGQALSLDEVRKQRFLLREQGSGTREVFDSFMETAGVHISPIWESSSTTALLNAAIHGLGIAVLPQRMILGPLQRGRIICIRIEEIDFTRTFNMVYHKNKFIFPALRRFMDLCRNYELDYPLPKYSGLF